MVENPYLGAYGRLLGRRGTQDVLKETTPHLVTHNELPTFCFIFGSKGIFCRESLLCIIESLYEE